MSETIKSRRPAQDSRPYRVGFLLVPEFPMMAFAAAVEPLRAANRLAGRASYEWRLFSRDGRPVRASNGIDVAVHSDVSGPAGVDLLLVCAGTHDTRGHGATLRWQTAIASERRSLFYASAEQTRATRHDFGDIPIIALTHSPYPKNADETQEERNERTLLWESLHLDVASMSSRGISIIVPHSGHYIQYDRPQVVIDAVDEVVAIARDQAAARASSVTGSTRRLASPALEARPHMLIDGSHRGVQP